jgi:hypothetical protein
MITKGVQSPNTLPIVATAIALSSVLSLPQPAISEQVELYRFAVLLVINTMLQLIKPEQRGEL